MKTKFLLHGGRLKLKDKRNDTYFQEITKGLKDGDIVLHVPFACQDESELLTTVEREKKFIQAQAKADIKIVVATPDDFMTQIKEAKALHICGGDQLKLIERIQKYPDFIKALAGKVVGGASAGACLFSTYYFSCKPTLEVEEGLGTFPIRLMVHWGNPEFNGTEDALEVLKTYPDDLELILLEESEWITKELEL